MLTPLSLLKSAGLGLMAVGLALLDLVETDASYRLVAAPFAIIAFGSGPAIPSDVCLIVGGSPPHLADLAAGLQVTCI